MHVSTLIEKAEIKFNTTTEHEIQKSWCGFSALVVVDQMGTQMLKNKKKGVRLLLGGKSGGRLVF
ncbi:MAG: hypothetical protein KDD09_09115 [Phaeodactylibacter sp.]|nr:hypothetical protein [Phaeodactylibacter sp.]